MNMYENYINNPQEIKEIGDREYLFELRREVKDDFNDEKISFDQCRKYQSMFDKQLIALSNFESQRLEERSALRSSWSIWGTCDSWSSFWNEAEDQLKFERDCFEYRISMEEGMYDYS